MNFLQIYSNMYIWGTLEHRIEDLGFGASARIEKLDDGWPEEQGLLLLVLRHYIARQYIKDAL